MCLVGDDSCLVTPPTRRRPPAGAARGGAVLKGGERGRARAGAEAQSIPAGEAIATGTLPVAPLLDGAWGRTHRDEGVNVNTRRTKWRFLKERRAGIWDRGEGYRRWRIRKTAPPRL